MRIYFAARYSRREELCKYRSELEKLGHEVTSRWLNGSHQVDDRGLSLEAKKEERKRLAAEDFQDVMTADLLIAFTEQPRSNNSRGGRHVEMGIALGAMKRVYVVGPKENVFCCLSEVHVFDSIEQLIGAL